MRRMSRTRDHTQQIIRTPATIESRIQRMIGQRRRGILSVAALTETVFIGSVVVVAVYTIPWVTVQTATNSNSKPVTGPIVRLQVSSTDGSLWAQHGFSELIRVDRETGAYKCNHKTRPGQITFACTSSNCETQLMVLDGRVIMVFRNEEVIFTNTFDENLRHTCQLSRNGKTLCCLSEAGKAIVWDLSDAPRAVWTAEKIVAISLDSTGERVYFIMKGGRQIQCCQFRGGETSACILNSYAEINNLELSDVDQFEVVDDGEIVVIRANSIQLVDAVNCAVKWQIPIYSCPQSVRLTTSEDGRWIAITRDLPGLRIIDRHTGRTQYQFPKNTMASQPAFSSSDNELFVGNSDGTVDVWSTVEWVHLRQLKFNACEEMRHRK